MRMHEHRAASQHARWCHDGAHVREKAHDKAQEGRQSQGQACSCDNRSPRLLSSSGRQYPSEQSPFTRLLLLQCSTSRLHPTKGLDHPKATLKPQQKWSFGLTDCVSFFAFVFKYLLIRRMLFKVP